MNKSPKKLINQSKEIILRQAIEDNDLAQVKFVLRFHIGRINDQDENRMTALHHSCLYGRIEIVRLLLEHGADLEVRDSKGWTALHFAANGGFLDVTSLLLSSCADAAALSYDGQLSIDVATGEGMVFLLASAIIRAGKEEILLRYFGGSTTSLRSIEEESASCVSLNDTVSQEILRASQQFLAHDPKTLRSSTSECALGFKTKTLYASTNKQLRKSYEPMMENAQSDKRTSKELRSFDSAFAPGVLRRLAVSETNLNRSSTQGDPNNNNVCGSPINRATNYYDLKTAVEPEPDWDEIVM
ncbi:predicted protein [Nematostella vectensis]|uniref:ANK_REP_REGION domain-containing protein n=1 Tax=Nematostella vectensis TaxID=45351 RepID=A7RKX6_NEMVE|nr:ankyrin repeat domain-containing protein 46 [Nematostella vectensis]EDO47759.1 predicted protein [Nematostella vectensis]|eukprot:XP_001639822.1 predicted protein [Nematostella vectensis]